MKTLSFSPEVWMTTLPPHAVLNQWIEGNKKKWRKYFSLGVWLNVLANQNALFFECGPNLREIGNLSPQQCMMQQFQQIVFPQFCGNGADSRRRVLRRRAEQWFFHWQCFHLHWTQWGGLQPAACSLLTIGVDTIARGINAKILRSKKSVYTYK